MITGFILMIGMWHGNMVKPDYQFSGAFFHTESACSDATQDQRIIRSYEDTLRGGEQIRLWCEPVSVEHGRIKLRIEQ